MKDAAKGRFDKAVKDGSMRMGLMRLAFRAEGGMWNAYLAGADSMKRAILLGSVRLVFVEDKERREAFMAIMQSSLEAMLHNQGVDPQWWNTRPAPEHERGGNA